VVESREVGRRVLVDGDHEISGKMDGMAIGLKTCFVKKA
jgi:uncharacterized Zn ribbon protein